MTEPSTSRGARIEPLAGTIPFKNWPFLVLLALIGLLVALVVGGARLVEGQAP
ncbi:hypothetical protein [Polyangium mundeleinium]|uniref:Uncharacterized protein n=1 Tax=Polyangium mundeleinium TaxID=2995306 RepID=A0ABT5EPG3_9BACT|nr:hypothetical protein [Polyangium mundeleinium]MDC0742812.1 hypothetical protein [Polyangium mundeleinium]